VEKSAYWQMINDHRFLADGHGPLSTRLFVTEAAMHVSDPVGAMTGIDEINARLWRPLLSAMPDCERRTDILLGGRFTDKTGLTGDWFASSGFFVGHFTSPLWGIAPTGRPVWLRYGWFDRIIADRVVESYVIFDVARLLMDAGQWPLAPQLGQSQWPAPQTQDGVTLTPAHGDDSAKSLALVEAMIGGLMQYDGKSLASMGMVRFWHPQFHWYGPGGIGSARGHSDYERAHQRPFLAAFPDRIGGNHKCRIGDGAYVASTGWPSINATHSGDSWLGLPATGKRVTMRIMDFWRRDGDMLAENWVFIDMIDLLAQIGVDVFARVRTFSGGTQP
jgi:predicted ester cyclase